MATQGVALRGASSMQDETEALISVRLSDRLEAGLLRFYTTQSAATYDSLATLDGVVAQLSSSGTPVEGLRALLTRFTGLRSWRQVTAQHVALVLEKEGRARSSKYAPRRSLLSYYMIKAQDDLTARDLLDFVRTPALAVDLAFATLVPDLNVTTCGATIDPATWAVTPDDLTSQQGYLHASPGGLNVSNPTVWGCYDGSGIGFVDLERGWKFDHSELQIANPHVIWPPAFLESEMTSIPHGTMDLGIVLGRDDGPGIVGLAPAANFLGCVSPDGTAVPSPDASATKKDFVNALLGALAVLEFGDVLLIEMEAAVAKFFDGYPVEVHAPWMDAIRIAAGNGIVVIEPAGNDENDLDHLERSAPTGFEPQYSITPGTSAFLDSGAILVGACQQATVTVGGVAGHERAAGTSFGARVDCCAWGEQVRTSQPPNGFGDHNGTSAASAQIAGVALLIQQAAVTRLGHRLNPATLRALLGDLANGTPVFHAGRKLSESNWESRPVPDVAKLIEVIELLPDVFLRDSLADAGIEPNPVLSQSPDIVNRTTSSLDQLTDLDSQPVSHPVTAGADNFVYVRILNRRVGPASGVIATVYWAETSTMVLPVDLNLIGTTSPVNAAGATVDSLSSVITPSLALSPPIVWHPLTGQIPPQLPVTHGCFFAVLDHPEDPAPQLLDGIGPLAAWTSFLELIGTRNNLAFRNFSLTPIGSSAAESRAAEFFFRGAPHAALPFDFAFQTNLPSDAQLRIALPAALAAEMEPRNATPSNEIRLDAGDIPSRLMDIRLPADARVPCSIRVWIPNMPPGRRQYQLTVRQFHRGRPVGALTLGFVTRGQESFTGE
jgi:hypothetical protein